MQNTRIDYFQRRQAWRTGIGLRLRLLERWARTHALIEPENANRIAGILISLKSDTLSLGLVGEISRGKSELINAIFFGADSHPVLPVGPGPTTLCPTEIRFQAQSASSLQLLPIQTTEDPRPLLAWQEQPASWTHVELAADNPGQVTEALLRITLTQAQESSADQSDQETKQSAVLPTPARARWRYAIVNLPHPTLEPDLRILDMPGSNALADEPERALGLLGTCDVLVFVLSADTGLTASERALWRQHLAQGEGAGCDLLVVLNKADAFWNSQHDVRTIERQLNQQRMDVATALGIAPERVVSVSASKANAAKGAGDAALLARSDLPKLEQLLWKTLFVTHHQRRQEDLSNELALCKAAMEQVLLMRMQELKQEKDLLLAQERPFAGRGKNTSVDETEIPMDYEKEKLRIQVIESTLLELLEKIRRTLQMPDLATTIATLAQNLRQSEGLPSVRLAYEKAQRDIQSTWRLVEHWAGEMGQILAASDPKADSKSDSTQQSQPPLQLAAYAALLQQALHGHLQFLGNSQVHKLKQADFTAKLVTAVRTSITDISQQICRSCEDWYDEATETLRQRYALNQATARQEPAQTGQTTAYVPNELQAREDKLERLNQTLDAYFLTLMEANGLD
jgi:hypothetical protein